MALRISTDLPYGNAADTAIRNDTDVEFSASPHGGMEALWFCFRVVGDGSGNGQIRLILKNPQNTLAGAPWSKFRPVIRTPKSDWERLPHGTLEDLPDGRVQVVWPVERPTQWLDVAFCYPYGVPQIEALIVDTGSYWRNDTVGVSSKERQIVRLSNAYGSPDNGKPGVYIVARQHAGETPGSWMLDGILRHLATQPDSTPLIWCVPLVNIDGIEEGDYGKDPHPIDLNKAWQRPFRQSMRYEIQCLERDIALWTGRCNPVLGLDFHAPGGTESDGIYAYIPNQFHLREAHSQSAVWAEKFRVALEPDYAAPEFTRTTSAQNYFSRWGSPEVCDRFSEYMWKEHSVAVVSTETPYAMCGNILMTRERYQEAGALMATALLEAIQS